MRERLHSILFIYDRMSVIGYIALIAFTPILFTLTVLVYPPLVAKASAPERGALNWVIGISAGLSWFLAIVTLWDVFRQMIRLTPTRTELLDKMRQIHRIDKIIEIRENDIIAKLASGATVTERDLVEHEGEIMAVVNIYWQFAPISEVFKLFLKVMTLVILLSLITMNLTCLWGEGFESLGPKADYLGYLHNTIVAMFLVGYDKVCPTESWARLWSIFEILGGIFILVVVLDFVTTTVYQEARGLPDAVRAHLLSLI